LDNALQTAHRISEFYRWDKEKRLILKPPYQRKPVWSLRNRSYLIDTILHNLPVPEIYLQIKTDREGNTLYEAVDGQQRLRSILEFIDGKYAILEDESEEYSGKEFSDLSGRSKEDFWNYQVVVRELKTNRD
jgi:uncharacterized protein with ParB-like and HNH nuclease domain